MIFQPSLNPEHRAHITTQTTINPINSNIISPLKNFNFYDISLHMETHTYITKIKPINPKIPIILSPKNFV